MATPTADSYSASSGAAVYAGRYGSGLRGSATFAEFLASGSMATAYSAMSGGATIADLSASGSVDGYFVPTWRSAMAANTWRAIPTVNKMSDLDPRYNAAMNPVYSSPPEWNGNGHASMMTAWCGGCFDLATDDFWIPIGGGHSDYGGNEPYKLNLYSDTPTWTMLRPPSGAIGNTIATNDGQEATGVYADGRPRAVHTWNRSVFVPGVGPCLSTHGRGWTSAAAGTTKFLRIHPTTGECTFGAANTYVSAIEGNGAGCAYDPSRHVVWYHGCTGGTFTKYDVATDTWTNASASFYVTGSVTNTGLTYIPGDDVIVWMHEYYAGGIRVYDPVTSTLHTPSVSGAFVGEFAMTGLCQAVWVPSLNALAVWDNTTNRTIINIITKPANPRTGTWVISQLTVSGSNTITPSARNSRSTFNRFQYSSRLDGFFLVNNTNEFPYFFALS